MRRGLPVLLLACLAIADSDLASAGAIELPAGQRVVIRKLLPTDCRALRAFVVNPIDGNPASKRRARVAEYPGRIGAGVFYSFNKNDGLHVTLPPGEAFNVVVLRGGAQTKMYADIAHIAEPTEDKLLWTFAGGSGPQVARFDTPVKAKTVSFFETKEGTIADVGFYRIGDGQADLGNPVDWAVGEKPLGAHAPTPAVMDDLGGDEKETRVVPTGIQRALRERYGGQKPFVLPLAQEAGAAELALKKDVPVHLVAGPFEAKVGLAAIGLEAEFASAPASLTVVIHDPGDQRLDLTSLELAVPKPGKLALVFDIPDQVVLKGGHLWLALKSDRPVKLRGANGGGPLFRTYHVEPAKALPQALAWRKMLLKGLFGSLSEPRPWGGYYKGMSREQFYGRNQYSRHCPQLFETIDYAHALAPTDSLIRQIREWVFSRYLDKFSDIPPSPEPPAGVPDWAWYPRLLWLDVRRIAEWWVDERMVPTGEFGGRLADDTTLYQRFADLPCFEKGGVAAKVIDGARRLAELGEREALKNGLNIEVKDALHAYERGLNQRALMAHWFYGDPIYFERCLETARSVEQLTMVTEDGRRHFRNGKRMGAVDLEKPRPPAIEEYATPAMWHPSFVIADYNRNPHILKVTREWADSWLKLMRFEERLWPMSVEVLTGKVTKFRKDRPLHMGEHSQAPAFLYLLALTGDKRYIEPFRCYYRQGEAAELARNFLDDVQVLGGLDDLAEETLQKLTRFNHAFASRLNGDPSPLVEASIEALRGARRWPDMYTTVHQNTDRIDADFRYLYHASKSYLGGYCGRNKFNPTQAVSWEGFGTDFGAFVLRNRIDDLEVAVYSYAEERVTGKMRVWRLEHGRYRLRVGIDGDGDFRIDGKPQSPVLELQKADGIELALAARAVTIIDISQVEKLDSIFGRADLAIAAREVEIEGREVKGMVHNLGSAEAPDLQIAVADATGRVVVKKSLGKLEAPVDLLPRRKAFALQLPQGKKEGYRLLIDPDDRVSEIFEGNNSVRLDALPAGG